MARRVAIVSLHRGGMMHAAAGLAESLLAADPALKPACFCPRDADTRALDARVETFRYRVPQTLSTGNLAALAWLPLTAARLRRDLVGWRPDVVHFNSGHVLLPLVVGSLARRFPVVATLHDAEPHPGERRPLEGVKLRALLRASRAVFVHGAGLRDRAAGRWGLAPEKLAVTDLVMAFGPGVAALPPAPGSRELLLFGRIHRYKGYDVFADALPLIAREVPDVRVTVAGTGDAACLRGLLTAHGERVRFVNRFLDDGELRPLFGAAAVVVLPYIEASQSGVACLAAAFGRPVAASRVGAIPGIVHDGVTGRLVAPARPRELAAAITGLLLAPDRAAAMGAAARRAFEDPARRRAAGHRLLNVYDGIRDAG